jgi:hypothetical protein
MKYAIVEKESVWTMMTRSFGFLKGDESEPTFPAF